MSGINFLSILKSSTGVTKLKTHQWEGKASKSGQLLREREAAAVKKPSKAS